MIPDRIKAILDEHGLEALEFEPGSTPTSRQAAAKLNVPVSHIAKSLLFVTKKREFHIIVAPGDARISNSKLRATLGGKARMATSEETSRITGFYPGGVSPFGVSIPVHIDVSLKSYDTIYPAAGTDSSGVPVSYQLLSRIVNAKECDCVESAATSHKAD